jgi:hypothetical protein
VFRRPEALQKTIYSLVRNTLASETDLYIFSDGPRPHIYGEAALVGQVREMLKNIRGFKSVQYKFSAQNMGLASSIINGVSDVIACHKKVIVLEDDLVVSANFLDFMNQALQVYEQEKKIFSVSGYSIPIVTKMEADVYFTKRASSWGWATWSDRWAGIDWTVKDYDYFGRNRSLQNEFNKMGSDLSGMLKKQMNQQINSWAIRWTFHQFRYNLLTVFPKISKVSNEGFSQNATHTHPSNRTRFATVLDRSSSTVFLFDGHPVMNNKIIREFTRPYSYPVRLAYKLRSFFQ